MSFGLLATTLTPLGASSLAFASWVTVTTMPPRVNVPVRTTAEVVAGTETVTEPGPVPADGDTDTQFAAVEADHAHSPRHVTLSVAVPPSGPTRSLVPDNEYWHPAASSITVNGRSAIISVAAREAAAEFGAAVNVTVPGPVAPAGETVTQLAALDAVHEQPACDETVTDPVPPVATTTFDVLLREKEHPWAS